MKYGNDGSLSKKIKFIKSTTWKLADAVDITAVIRGVQQEEETVTQAESEVQA